MATTMEGEKYGHDASVGKGLPDRNIKQSGRPDDGISRRALSRHEWYLFTPGVLGSPFIAPFELYELLMTTGRAKEWIGD